MQLLVNSWLKIKHNFPRSRSFLFSVVQRNRWLYRTLLFRYVDAKDRKDGVAGGLRLPPAELRYRVSSSPDAAAFLRLGENCARDIQSALATVGRQLDSFSHILDFGCGCGRTLLHLPKYVPAATVHGADIDPDAISWCQKHLRFAEFNVVDPLPPTDYPAGTFDLISAISVFTHLDEDYQLRWLEELRRIAQPGAFLLLTVDSSRAGEDGFAFLSSYEEGIFPKWYQNAFHSKEYVFRIYSRFFNVVDYIPQGMNNHQDVVILRKS
ncbi:MAG: class I SAM-dependent methyltransferase [Rubrivivax sp.]|nr:class I SAM-dependent methyltransferase [Pyrinomonadaceae bacterium]